MPEEKPLREFYSTAQYYNLRYSLGTPVISNGLRLGRENEEILEFKPFGKFGRYATNDPDKIAFLEKQGDLFGPEEFARRVTPIEQQMEQQKRTIEQQNRLIEQLTKQAQRGGAPSLPKP